MVKDYLTDALTGLRKTYACARCGTPCATPDALEQMADVPICQACLYPLNAVMAEERFLTPREVMEGMGLATPEVH